MVKWKHLQRNLTLLVRENINHFIERTRAKDLVGGFKMHRYYARDVLRICQAMTREEAFDLMSSYANNKYEEAIKKEEDWFILSRIKDSSQNSLCFYPKKLYYDEALRRGLNIQDIVSELPLLSKPILYVPKGVEFPSSGKYFDEVLLSPDDHYWYKYHWINQDKKLNLKIGFCTRDELPEIPDLSLLPDYEIYKFLENSSLNSLSFYPNRCYLDEAVKRNFLLDRFLSSLPLLSDAELWIPQGVKLWSSGKIYREI